MKALILLLVIFLSGSCTPQDNYPSPGVQLPAPPTPDTPEQPENPSPPEQPDTPTSNNMTIKINNRNFSATLTDNSTAESFKKLLPLRITMSELNGNEKYYYLPGSLPTASQNAGRVNKGDIMLFGGSTLVIFYKSFSTSYSYTPIGRLDNPSDLESVMGRGAVNVEFEIE